MIVSYSGSYNTTACFTTMQLDSRFPWKSVAQPDLDGESSFLTAVQALEITALAEMLNGSKKIFAVCCGTCGL